MTDMSRWKRRIVQNWPLVPRTRCCVDIVWFHDGFVRVACSCQFGSGRITKNFHWPCSWAWNADLSFVWSKTFGLSQRRNHSLPSARFCMSVVLLVLGWEMLVESETEGKRDSDWNIGPFWTRRFTCSLVPCSWLHSGIRFPSVSLNWTTFAKDASHYIASETIKSQRKLLGRREWHFQWATTQRITLTHNRRTLRERFTGQCRGLWCRSLFDPASDSCPVSVKFIWQAVMQSLWTM